MKKCFLLLGCLASCLTINAQNLDSLFEKGKSKEIVGIYEVGTGTFDNNQLEIVAAAYDKLERLSEEGKVLDKLTDGFPLFLTYTIPANYMYYGNFIKAGSMEKNKTFITRQYLNSIMDSSLGIRILDAYYRDQSVRQKHLDNGYRKKNGLKIKWDNVSLMKEWARIDSSNTLFIAQVFHDNKEFPSRANIGLIGTTSLFILMQHLDIGYRGRYDKLLFDAACRKDISMTDYAMYKTMTLVRTHQIADSLFQNTLDSLSEIKCR